MEYFSNIYIKKKLKLAEQKKIKLSRMELAGLVFPSNPEDVFHRLADL